MANAFQFKRGTTTRRLTYTPLSGELVYDTTLNKMFIGDGITAGGIPLKTEADKLYTPRTINGVAFDGTSDISINTTPTRVKVVATSNITLSGLQTIDGVALVAGDRVLARSQVPTYNGGIWIASSGAWARASDANTIDKMVGMIVSVELGTINGGSSFTNSVKATDLLGSNPIVWYQIMDARFGGNVAGRAPGTASSGSSPNFARQDHVHPLQTTISGNAATATKLATARLIGGVAFDGSANINLPGVNTTGNQSTSGNAGTATKLETPRTINGVAFDGSADITLDQNNGVFLGSVQWYSGKRASVPDGYVTLDGQLVNRTAFPDLWAAVNSGAYPLVTDSVWLAGTANRASYSSGNGTTTFRLPDLNGFQENSLEALFVRGDGNGSIAGVATTIGSVQGDAIRNITGSSIYGQDADGTTIDNGLFDGAMYYDYSVVTPDNVNAISVLQNWQYNKWYKLKFDASRVVPTASENRPVSAVGVWIVRATGATSPLPASGSPATLLANTFNGSQKIVGNLEVTGNLDISGTLAFAKGFENSLTENGWQKLPGGLILQWGTASLVASSGGTLTQPVTYPIAFPNDVLHIFMGYREFTGSSADSPYSRDRTNTGFNIGQTAGEAHTCSWLAIGL